jgi:hypothetical protein
MASDRSVLAGVHELFPPVEQAHELLQVYGGWSSCGALGVQADIR